MRFLFSYFNTYTFIATGKPSFKLRTLRLLGVLLQKLAVWKSVLQGLPCPPPLQL